MIFTESPVCFTELLPWAGFAKVVVNNFSHDLHRIAGLLHRALALGRLCGGSGPQETCLFSGCCNHSEKHKGREHPQDGHHHEDQDMLVGGMSSSLTLQKSF